ncbi:PIN domain-containing protein [[Kitasatospora] papulosa]|uniref:PIN domain-containing protein n=1 Tax=[Kitasatospora] papulosa TaxID=1464011 RepID=UPI003719054E
MIIFDTNAVNLLPPEGPRADIIRKLRQSKHHRVAVPWMVLEEMAAHQAKLYPEKYRAVMNTLEKLRTLLPWDLESSLEPLDLERFLDHWRGVYGEIFEVIETSGEVARKALAREAMALPPAKRSKDHSEGARDVAIWFSILEFLKENPEENICFVTNNTSDFGDGSTFPYPMNEDLRGLEGRLTRLTDFDQVVSRFTKEVAVEDAEATASELLKSLAVRSLVAQTALETLSSPTGFTGLGPTDALAAWHEWLATPEVDLLSVTDVTGHEIEGDVWYTASAKWLLYGLVADGPDPDAQYVACVWEMKVLLSAHDGHKAPTLLQTCEPSLPDTSDQTSMDTLQHLKERVAGLSRRALRNLKVGISPVGRPYAEGLVTSLPKLDIANSSMQQLAEQIAATRAGLYNGPVQQLAEQVAAIRADLFKSPVHPLAEQIAAMQADLYRSPAQQLTKQFAAMQAELKSPMQRIVKDIVTPKLDIAASLPRAAFTVPLPVFKATTLGKSAAIAEDSESEKGLPTSSGDQPITDQDSPARKI